MAGTLRMVFAASGATGAVLAGACGGGGGQHLSAGPPAAGPAASTPATGSMSASGGPTGPTGSADPSGPGRCGTGMLAARLRMAGPAAGSRYAVLVLTNQSVVSCRVHGYAGMLLLAASGAALPTNVIRLRPGPPAVVPLRPGQSAWAMVHWSVVPDSGEPQHGPCQPTPGRAWVTPPDERTQLTVAWDFGPVCQHGTIRLDPFAAGTGPSGG